MKIAALLLPLAPLQSTPETPPKPPTVIVETFTEEIDGGAGGLDVDAQGNVYCADFGALLGGSPGTRVYKIDPSGEVSVFADGLRGASGNAFGLDGELYQSNIAGNFISRIDAQGKATKFLAENLASPVGIAIAESGELYIANCGSGRIIACTPEGQSGDFCVSSLLSCPNGITIGPEQNLFVANFNNGDVIKITPTGEASRLATLPGKNNGHILFHDDKLFVVARGAHQIYTVSLTGEVELLAGSGKRGRDDGPALEATFSFPNDIAVSPDGKYLYVNENASTTKPHNQLAPMIVRRIRLR